MAQLDAKLRHAPFLGCKWIKKLWRARGEMMADIHGN